MNTNPESRRFLRRSLVCAVAVFIFFLLLLFRLMYLQIVKNKFYATLSNRNVINIVPVPPKRGIIYDRNGVVLAKNIPVYSLMVIPGRVKSVKDTLTELQKMVHLTPDDLQNFHRLARQYYPSQAVPLKQQLTETEVDTIYVNQYHLPGVIVQANMIRNYPLAETTSSVVGYVGRITANELSQVDPTDYTASDNIGKAGIEAEDETLLHGTPGALEAEIDANGKVVRTLKTTPPISGDNIYLTIDSKLQAFAEKVMGKNSGAIVAIQPATGQVLASVSKPGYDPNAFVNGMTNAQYHALMNAPDHPLFDRTVRGLYAPGSTIKPFIAFGALNDGVVNKNDTIFDPGWFRLPNTTHIFHNWKKNGFGTVNISQSIMVSCDTFFYTLAVALGIDRLDQAITQFGFGSLTGINLPSERSGIVPSPHWKMKHIGKPWYTGDTVVAGIGQGYILVTPIQLAAATSIMAERGLKFQPALLLKLQQSSGAITTMQPIEEKSIVAKDPQSWNTVIHAMQNVISNSQGTAYSSFQGIQYTVAGKTGTAQVYADKQDDDSTQQNVSKRLQNNHLFICFAPADNPQIAIAIVVEHVEGVKGMTPIAVQMTRQILDFYMNELKQPGASAPTSISTATTPADTITPTAIPAPKSAPVPSATLPTPQKIEHTQSDMLPTPQDTPQNSDVLQQEMDMNVDTQVDLQSENKENTDAVSPQ